MNENKTEILEIIKETTENFGFLLIDVLLRGDRKNRVIEIYIDNEAGITTDDCALVSREIGKIIDEKNLIESNYRLEVSSPGVSRPLEYLPQYLKHIGRQFDIKYDVMGETQRFKGRLTKVEESKLWFVSGKTELVVDFEKMIKAKVLTSF